MQIMKKGHSRTVKGLQAVVLFAIGLFLFKRSAEVLLFVLEHGDILRCPLTGFNHGMVLWIGLGVTTAVALVAIAFGFILFRNVLAKTEKINQTL